MNSPYPALSGRTGGGGEELNGFQYSPEEEKITQRAETGVVCRVHASYCSLCYLNL